MSDSSSRRAPRAAALLCPIGICLSAAIASAESTGFRGPTGDGIFPGEAPAQWSREQGVGWRTPLPSPGNGSPAVAGGRVYIAGAEDSKGTRRSLYCFDAKNGGQLWARTLDFDKAMPTHDTNPHGSTTPAVSVAANKVVVWHASAGLICYDLGGTEQWRRDLGEFRHMWGYGSSPRIEDGRVYLYCGPGTRTFVTALDLESGRTLWETEEPMQGGNAEYTEEKHYRGAWSTPILVRTGDRRQLICAHPTRVVGYDPDSGRILWSCDGLKGPRGELAYSSPLMAGDICVVIGGFNGPSIGFRPGGEGDITGARRLWRTEKNPQSIGSGIHVGAHIYVPFAGSPALRCIDPKTGEVVWEDTGGLGACWGSVVRSEKLAYVTDQSGATLVFEPSPEGLKSIAVNRLDEPCNATPAIADGAIFLRTHKALYRIDGTRPESK